MSSTHASQAPQHGAEHERLKVFLGKWHAEGFSFSQGQNKSEPRGKPEKWVSDETCEWLPGQFFMLQRWDAMTGTSPFKGLAILSHNGNTGAYMTRSYENRGFIRDYATSVGGDVWSFVGDTERAQVEFTDGGKTQRIFWEWRKPGEDWLPLCDRVARRLG